MCSGQPNETSSSANVYANLRPVRQLNNLNRQSNYLRKNIIEGYGRVASTLKFHLVNGEGEKIFKNLNPFDKKSKSKDKNFNFDQSIKIFEGFEAVFFFTRAELIRNTS